MTARIPAILLSWLFLSGTAFLTAQTIEEYTARRVAAIVVPPPAHNLHGTAAKTYVYWHKAAAEVGICMDSATIRKDYFWTAGKVGPLITNDLRIIPQEGVDPDAVQAVLQIADLFDDMRQIAHGMTDSAAKIGVALGGGPSGSAQDGETVLSGPDRVLAMLRERDKSNRKLIELLQYRYGIAFHELVLEDVSPTAGRWLGYDGVCAGGL
jgi:hypothetical protein